MCPQRPPHFSSWHSQRQEASVQHNWHDPWAQKDSPKLSCISLQTSCFSVFHQSLYWCTHLMAEVFHMRSSDAMNCHYVHNPTATGRRMVPLVPPQPAPPPLPALRWLTNFHLGKLPWWDMMYWHEIWSFVHDQQIVTINAERWHFSWLEYRDIRNIVYTDLGS